MSEKTEKTDRENNRREHGELLRRFRKIYGVTLEELAARVRLSQPMLTRFEHGSRGLSMEAWARVLVAMSEIEKEKFAERQEMDARLEATRAPTGDVLSDMLAGRGALAFLDSKRMEELTQQIKEGEERLELSKLMGPHLQTAAVFEKSKILRQLKNPKFAKQFLEDYLSQVEWGQKISDWRQKLLDLEAKGYVMMQPKSIEQVIVDLDAQGYAVITKDMEQERKQLRARVAELEQELARERAKK